MLGAWQQVQQWLLAMPECRPVAIGKQEVQQVFQSSVCLHAK